MQNLAAAPRKPRSEIVRILLFLIVTGASHVAVYWG